jgi:hypothetical protein
MFTRILALGVLIAGAAGQWACTETAEAAQVSQATEADKASRPREGQLCGGFAALSCPEGLSCVDDPQDSCDPNEGGRDCSGICVDPSKQKPPKCDYKDPNLSYVSRDPNQCPAIMFKCPEGSTAFFNECGCGCKNPTQACSHDDPNRRYLAQDPEQCAALRFVCNTGESAFFDECGCGCETMPTPTP